MIRYKLLKSFLFLVQREDWWVLRCSKERFFSISWWEVMVASPGAVEGGTLRSGWKKLEV